jgi:starch synthase
MPELGVLMVASEMAPWAKTGGLADVLSGLPEALDHLGYRVTTVLPRYRGMALPPAESSTRSVHLGPKTHEVSFHVARLPESRRVVFVDYPPFFDRAGYYGSGSKDFADNDQRFGLLAVAALDFAQHEVTERVDIVHAHDWQAGLVPTLLKTEPQRWTRLASAGQVLTIHNLAYQGLFPRESVPALGLDWRVFTIEGGEFWGQFSFLKSGIGFSDVTTTVSPSYAEETLSPEFGAGLEGMLLAKGDRYVGIVNGIDTRVWDPSSDPHLPANYDAEHLSGKRVCKRALLERFGLPMGDDALKRPLIGLVSRLVAQKGIDLVEEASRALFALDASWVFLGSGEPAYEQFLRDLAAKYPSRVGVRIGFDEPMAHLLEAGCDVFLMPSRFEPCGLNQMYSLRYGTVPVVHGVGGLEDTIQSYTSRARRANGFKFREPSAAALTRAMQSAVRLYGDREAWERLMRQAMHEDHSWETSAREYVKVYRRARQQAAVR